MEEAALDPLLAFSWLVSELLGRAVSACITNSSAHASANPAYKKVTLELAQSPQRPGQIMIKVSDEGYGLGNNLKAVKHAFTALQRPLASSCVKQDAGLLLRTTNLAEKTIRRYHACINTTNSNTLEVVKVPVEEEKAPGIQISGTQATLLFSSNSVPPDAALVACQQLLSMLSTLCPPVNLILKAQNLLLQDNDSSANLLHQSRRGEESQTGNSVSSTATTATAAAATASLPRTTTFARHLEPFPSTSLLSYMQRLKKGLLEEFPSYTGTPAAANATSPTPAARVTPSSPPPLFRFVGVGEGAVPRGCKWNACAGIVLQLPDHAAIATATLQAEEEAAAAQAQFQYQFHSSSEERLIERRENTGTASAASGCLDSPPTPTPAYLFKAHAVQFTDNINYIDALRRVNWSGHGFKLMNINNGLSTSSSPTSTAGGEGDAASVEPVSVVLQCEQPQSMASIAAIVVHLYYDFSTTTAAATPQVTTQPSSQIDSSINTLETSTIHTSNTSTSQQQEYPQQQQKTENLPFSSTPKFVPTKLAPLHQRTLIRTAIDAALSDLKQQCPSVISDRRDRSLTRALPVVSTAVAGILNRAVGEGVLFEACHALQVREVDALGDALHRKLEEVIISAQLQQQQQQQQ